jgi:sugar phosphate isomerase/epimerase
VTSVGIAPLGFSTLACPEWDAATVIERAAAYGYDSVEWRGGPDGTVRVDWPTAVRRALRRRADALGVGALAVSAYPTFIDPRAAVVDAAIEDVIRHAELAADLAAPVVRVFVGVPADDPGDAALARRAIDGLGRLLERVRPLGVAIAIEPHDEHVRVSALRPILDALPDRGLGVVWDIANAWSAGEPPEIGLAAYAGRIRYVQLKDGTGRGSSWQLCALGEGQVPIDRALAGLARWSAESGLPWPPVSLEWERAWHHDLAPAAAVLPLARPWMAERLAAVARAVDQQARG